MSIQQDVQKPYSGGIVSLYEIDLTDIGGSLYRLSPHTNGPDAILWQGNSYAPYPMELTGVSTNGQGVQPSPILRISNINKIIASAIQQLGDVVGGKVTRKRTYDIYLDGQPGADQTQEFRDEVYYIQQKSSLNKKQIEFTLSTALARENITLPRRLVLRTDFPGVSRVADV